MIRPFPKAANIFFKKAVVFFSFPRRISKTTSTLHSKQTHILMTVRKGLLGETVPFISPANIAEKDREALNIKAFLWRWSLLPTQTILWLHVKLSPDWLQAIIATERKDRCMQLARCSAKRGLMGTGALGAFPHWPEQRVAELPSAFPNSSLIQTQDTTAGIVSFQLCSRQCQASQMGTT